MRHVMARVFFVCTVVLSSCIVLVGCTGIRSRSSSAAAQLGVVDFPISCKASLQPDFNHAVALLHHMTYPQARESFRTIAEKDPGCAMAQWGIAMTLFQPLWPTRPSAADLQLGWQSAQNALALKPPTLREQLFVRSAVDFFQDPDSGDYWLRIRRWEAALKNLHDAFPQDPDASAFFALALLATAQQGPTPREQTQQAVDLLLQVYRQNPNHPGAMHYIVHADDVPGRERENLDIVHRYEEIAPDNPHALHMPTHIYTRLGDWDDVIAGNLRAADAALRYPAGTHNEFVWDEFAHAIEYLVYAYLQETADEKAAAQIARLVSIPNLEPTAKTAFHLSSTRARYALERHAWAEAAALVPREPSTIDWDRFPWPEAVTWFARGYGAVRSGNVSEGEKSAARLQELETRAEKSGETSFAHQIQILRFELAAWIAHVHHDDMAAVALLRQAVDAETSNPKPPVTPAATLPAAEILGDLMLDLDRPNEARAAYKQSLEHFPRRFNSTLGLVRSKVASGDTSGAAESYCELLRISANGTRLQKADEWQRSIDAADWRKITRDHQCAR